MARRRPDRFLVVVACGLAAVGPLTGCRRDDGSRERALVEFTEQLVDGGLEPSQANCIAAAFFDGRTNEQLNEFFDRPALTNEEWAEFAALTEECAPTSTS